VKALLEWLCIIFTTIGAITVALVLVILTHEMSGEVMYNCDLAEMHPDYPAKVKEECRKMRSSNITI
jgi:hypothetical protein